MENDATRAGKAQDEKALAAADRDWPRINRKLSLYSAEIDKAKYHKKEWLRELLAKAERLILEPVLRSYSDLPDDIDFHHVAERGRLQLPDAIKRAATEAEKWKDGPPVDEAEASDHVCFFSDDLTSLGMNICLATPPRSDEELDLVFPSWGALQRGDYSATADPANLLYFVCGQIAWQAVSEGWAICFAEDGLANSGGILSAFTEMSPARAGNAASQEAAEDRLFGDLDKGGGVFSVVPSGRFPTLGESGRLFSPQELGIEKWTEWDREAKKLVRADHLWFCLTRDLLTGTREEESGKTPSNRGGKRPERWGRSFVRNASIKLAEAAREKRKKIVLGDLQEAIKEVFGEYRDEQANRIFDALREMEKEQNVRDLTFPGRPGNGERLEQAEIGKMISPLADEWKIS